MKMKPTTFELSVSRASALAELNHEAPTKPAKNEFEGRVGTSREPQFLANRCALRLKQQVLPSNTFAHPILGQRWTKDKSTSIAKQWA